MTKAKQRNAVLVQPPISLDWDYEDSCDYGLDQDYEATMKGASTPHDLHQLSC